jgi:hypothetical protein
MELVWDSCALTLQRAKGSISMQRRKQGPQVSPNNCKDILCFLQDFSVLICKQHQTAVVNLNTHLLQHHNVPTAAQRQIIEHFSQRAVVDLTKIQLPDKPAQPIQELRLPLDGLQCKTCGYITINKDTVRMHCKKEHQQA